MRRFGRRIPAKAMLFGPPLAAAGCLLLWMRTLEGGLLVAALVLLAVASLMVRWTTTGSNPPAARFRRPPLMIGLVLLALAAAAALWSDRRIGSITGDWESVVAERHEDLSIRLDGEMDRILERGARALDVAVESVGGAERRAPDGPAIPVAPDRFAMLQSARDAGDVAAVALMDPAGTVRAWAGDHRGPLPASVRTGFTEANYVERPLFGYLYLSRPAGDGGARAVVALLLDVDVALSDAEPASFVDRFAARHGARPRFAAGTPTAGSAWQLDGAAGTVMHARFDRPEQAELRAEAVTRGRRATALPLLSALVLLLAAFRRRGEPAGAPDGGENAAVNRVRGGTSPWLFAAAAGVLLLLPLADLLGVDWLFSPAAFMVPGPLNVLNVTLGHLLAVLIPLGALAAVSGSTIAREVRWTSLVAASAVVGVGYPAILMLLLGGASRDLLVGGAGLWAGLQAAAVLALAVLTVPLLRLVRQGSTAAGMRRRPDTPDSGNTESTAHEAGRNHAGAVILTGGLVLAVIFGLGLGFGADPRRGARPWLAAAWVLPFLMISLGAGARQGWSRRSSAWWVAGWLAATAVLPQLSLAHIEARLGEADRELGTLGIQADPYRDYLVHQFETEVRSRSSRGEGGVALLYRSWVASRLAQAGYPVRITLWNAEDQVVDELPLGDEGFRGTEGSQDYLLGLMRQARSAGVPLNATAPDMDVNRATVVPLGEGRVVSLLVQPRRTLESGPTLLGALLRENRPSPARLTLVPARSNGSEPTALRAAEWRRSGDGWWRIEEDVLYPDGPYRARLEVRVAPERVRVVRASLMAAAIMAGCFLLWVVGRIAVGALPGPSGGWSRWIASFRARITLTLFAFFLIPTLLFGAVAYRTLPGEVQRSASLVARQSAEQAATGLEPSGFDLDAVAERIDREVLLFLDGELAAASERESMDLGLYDAWIPPNVFLRLSGGEGISEVAAREVVGHPYMLAYHRLEGTGTVGVPVPLGYGDSVTRQRELTHTVLFIALLGGLLSLGLSVLVGRTLAGPIERLRWATGAVGSGRLRTRLPEDRRDEFGELFAAFNAMTDRLRRARTSELRTARIVAWGEVARQVAHEIKNPLTPIKLSIQHVRRAHRDGRADFGRILEENVQQILGEIDRLGEIARVFSRYGSPSEESGPLQSVDLESIVGEILTLYRSGEGALQYRARLAAGLPRVRSREHELKEVLVNLLENARAALEEPGAEDQALITISAEQAKDDGVALTVADNGEGIPPELLPRVFEPQFSTRSSGTGLGLSIVQRLVESWGGRVSVRSTRGEGTRVELWIPAATAAAMD